jgi:hypothetical protein
VPWPKGIRSAQLEVLMKKQGASHLVTWKMQTLVLEAHENRPQKVFSIALMEIFNHSKILGEDGVKSWRKTEEIRIHMTGT